MTEVWGTLYMVNYLVKYLLKKIFMRQEDLHFYTWKLSLGSLGVWMNEQNYKFLIQELKQKGPTQSSPLR
jgi:hypothetical protein